MAINQFTTEQQDRYNELIGAGSSELEARGAVSLIPAKSQLSASETTLPETNLPTELPQEADIPTQINTSDFDKNYKDLFSENSRIRDLYLQSLQPTEQEQTLEQQIAKIKESAGLGIQDIKEQTIPMGAIVGQAKNVEERANLQLSTLADQLGIAQKGRLANQEALKTIGGFIGEDIKLVQDVQERIDTQNQQYIENAQKLSADARGSLATILENFVGVDPNTLDAESQAQISQIAANAGLTPSLVFAGMKAVKDQQDFENYQKTKKDTETTGPSEYSTERAARTVASVNELMKQVSPFTVGYGSLLSGLPSSQARYFRGQLDTLKSNIAFNELTAMREASKTGGALGQVSDREGKLLESALGSLDQGLSPAQITEQLNKVKNSILRWQTVMNQSAKPATDLSAYEE